MFNQFADPTFGNEMNFTIQRPANDNQGFSIEVLEDLKESCFTPPKILR